MSVMIWGRGFAVSAGAAALVLAVSLGGASTASARPDDEGPAEKTTGADCSAVDSGRTTAIAADETMDWFRRHQSPEGSWSAGGYASRCNDRTCTGAHTQDAAVETTAMVVLVYCGFAETTDSENAEHRTVLRKAYTYLRQQLRKDGGLGDVTQPGGVWRHALVTHAFVEGYGLNGSKMLKSVAQPSVKRLLSLQLPDGGWGDAAGSKASDVVTTAAAVLALRSAKMAVLADPQDAFAGALRYLDSVTDPKTGIVRSAAGKGGAEALTAAAVCARCMAHESAEEFRGDAGLRKGLAWLAGRYADEGRALSPADDLRAWNWAATAARQVGGNAQKPWDARWNAWSRGEVETTSEDCDRGSREPRGATATAGGRVWATAYAALGTQVPYRYGRRFE